LQLGAQCREVARDLLSIDAQLRGNFLMRHVRVIKRGGLRPPLGDPVPPPHADSAWHI
jgi:hypothetical protein